MEGRLLLACFSAAFALLSWLLPNHYFPWVTFYSDFSAFLLLLVMMGWLVLCRGLAFSLSTLVLVVVACIPVVQWGVGLVVFGGDAFMVSLYLLGAAIAIAVGRGMYSFAGGKGVEVAAWIVVVGSVVSIWIALVQWLSLSGSIFIVDLPYGRRPYANMAQPNNLATFLCAGLASVLYLWERSRIGAWPASILATLLLFGVGLTQSRTPWVGAIFLLVWWCWKSRACGLHLPAHKLLMWVAGYAALVLLFPYISESLYLPTVSLLERAQALHRLDLWRQLWFAVLAGDWWGYGWNQVSTAQIAVALQYAVPLLVEHSHNVLLDLLLWNGPLIGGVIIVLGSLWLGGLAWRSGTLESVYALLVVGFVFLHAMLEFPLEYAFFLIPTCLLLGMVEADQNIPAIVKIPHWAGVLGCVLGVVLMVWVWREYRVIEEDHRLMRFETARIGHLRAERIAPDVMLLDQLREFLRFARTEARPGMTMEELDWMKRVAHRYPYPPSIFRYTLALSLNGRAESAAIEMMRLRSLHGEELYQEARAGLMGLGEEYPQLTLFDLPE